MDLRRRALRGVSAHGPRAARRARGHGAPAPGGAWFDAAARLSEIDAATLVLHGTEDRVVPPANGELLAHGIAGACLERLNGAGHMFWWEQPERSAALIRAQVSGAAV